MTVPLKPHQMVEHDPDGRASVRAQPVRRGRASHAPASAQRAMLSIRLEGEGETTAIVVSLRAAASIATSSPVVMRLHKFARPVRAGRSAAWRGERAGELLPTRAGVVHPLAVKFSWDCSGSMRGRQHRRCASCAAGHRHRLPARGRTVLAVTVRQHRRGTARARRDERPTHRLAGRPGGFSCKPTWATEMERRWIPRWPETHQVKPGAWEGAAPVRPHRMARSAIERMVCEGARAGSPGVRRRYRQRPAGCAASPGRGRRPDPVISLHREAVEPAVLHVCAPALTAHGVPELAWPADCEACADDAPARCSTASDAVTVWARLAPVPDGTCVWVGTARMPWRPDRWAGLPDRRRHDSTLSRMAVAWIETLLAGGRPLVRRWNWPSHISWSAR